MLPFEIFCIPAERNTGRAVFFTFLVDGISMIVIVTIRFMFTRPKSSGCDDLTNDAGLSKCRFLSSSSYIYCHR
jgi:hypothetical protein